MRPEHQLRPNTAEDVTRLREAEQGDALAQFSLGEAYEIGDGVLQDDAQAYAWYRKSAEQGLARAQFSVGWAYVYGRGVQADDADAFEWFRKAADQGHARAQFEVAAAYHEARGVAIDCRQAREYFRKAAEQGLAEAQFAYGSGFFFGLGPVTDDFAIGDRVVSQVSRAGVRTRAAAAGRSIHARLGESVGRSGNERDEGCD